MNSENAWIPWNERTDLKIMYFIYEYRVGYGFVYFPKNLPFEEYTPGNNYERIRRFISLERMPDNKDVKDHFLSNFFKKFEIYRKKEFGGCTRLILESYFYIVTADKLSSDERLLAHEYKEYVKNENSFLYQTVMEIRNSLEKFDKSESILNSSQTVNISASAPVADVPAAPADKDSPADKTAKPERQKATEKDIQNAIAELQKYFRSNNIDYMQKTIIRHLKEKLGIVFDLSPRTRLGKYYAVLYYDKTGIPPRNWTESKILDVKKELEKKVS